RGELALGHLEAAVAHYGPDLLARVRERGADRGRPSEAHRARAAARDPMSVRARETELCGPHLVLTDVGGDDRIALRDRVQPVEHVLRAQPTLPRVLERILLAPSLALPQPGFRLRHLDQRNDVLDHEARVAEDRDVGPDDLVELGRIDVDVDLHRAGAELVELTRDAVVP